jgi:hypothetical protein
MTTSRVHQLVELLSRAATRLGATGAVDATIERCASLIHRAMDGQSRIFHSHDHVLELADGGDPTSVIAALFHDVVYVQVDGGLSAATTGLLGDALVREPDGWHLPDGFDRNPSVRLVARVFGVTAGPAPSPFAGLNELCSALVAVRALEPILAPRQLAEVAACIEATIPFRPATPDGQVPLERLASRLRAASDELDLGFDASAIVEATERACRLANQDVANFADPEHARFLDNTWKLLPETNPALHSPQSYTLREYRTALAKMEGFLSSLPAERVFQRFGSEPAQQVHEARLAAAARNLAVATRYLRAKLNTLAMLEAMAEVSGGDAPLELFMGALPRPSSPAPARVEQFLPAVTGEAAFDVDPALLALLSAGRASDTDFDLRTSPLSARIYRQLGEAATGASATSAGRLFRGELSASAFLATCPPAIVAEIAHGLSEMVPTRRAALRALAALD